MRYHAIATLLLPICLFVSCSEEKTTELLSPDALHAPPVLLTPEFGTVAGHPLFLSWKSDFDYASFRVQIDTNEQFTAPSIDRTVTGAQQVELVDYPEAMVVYWRVGGVEEGYVRWSARRELRTRLHADGPALLSPADKATLPSEVEMRWEEHPRSQRYSLRVSTTPDFSSPLLDTTFTGVYAYTMNDPVGNTEYHWNVGVHIQDTVFWSETRTFQSDIPPPAGYRSCTIEFDGIELLVEQRFSGPGGSRKDTTTVSLADFEDTFQRSQSTGMRFDLLVKTEYETRQIELEWPSPSIVQNFGYNLSYDRIGRYPGGEFLEREKRQMAFTLAPMNGGGGVHEISGASSVQAAFLTFEYSALFDQGAKGLISTSLLKMQFTPDAAVRLRFQ